MEEQEKKTRRISLQSIGCFILLILILCICGFVYIFIQKPPAAWDRLVSFANGDGYILEELPATASEAREFIQDQITEIGENIITIPEDYVTVLARDTFPELKDLTAHISNDTLHLYWIFQESRSGEALLGYVAIQTNNQNELFIDSLGTPRVALPAFLNQAIASAALTFLRLGDNAEGQDNLLSILLDANRDLEITDVAFVDDSVVLTVLVEIEF